MNKYVPSLTLLFLLLFSNVVFAATPTIVINKTPVLFDVPPAINNGLVMAPARTVLEAIGAYVYWDGQSRTVTATNGKTSVKLIIGAKTAYLNNYSVKLQAPPQIVNGRVFIPVRFAGETFGYKVSWDAATQTAMFKAGYEFINSIATEPDITKITISAIGDCTLGNDDRFDYKGSFNETFSRQNSNYGYFFSNVSPLLKTDDLTIANLETTLTNAKHKANKNFQKAPFFFKGYPSYTNILENGSIEAVNLANNHSFDYLWQGYIDTIENLKMAGIGYFGYDQRYLTIVKGIKIGLLGYNDLGVYEEGTDTQLLKRKVSQDINELKKQCDLVIVSFHWGVEGSKNPTSRQIELGHFAVDSGADLVLGHHPHVIQPIEHYRGKYIVYSLANFCFGGNKNPSDKDTFIFQQTFSFRNGRLIEQDEKQIIPCSISSVPNRNDYRPTILTGKDRERVLQRAYIIESS